MEDCARTGAERMSFQGCWTYCKLFTWFVGCQRSNFPLREKTKKGGRRGRGQFLYHTKTHTHCATINHSHSQSVPNSEINTDLRKIKGKSSAEPQEQLQWALVKILQVSGIVQEGWTPFFQKIFPQPVFFLNSCREHCLNRQFKISHMCSTGLRYNDEIYTEGHGIWLTSFWHQSE